uniref:Uncharacterized protein n=2 Tax=Micrurus lemniscatus lemniscatus TaxID=129467 RepID=A0A2D4I9H9_MICLE
MFNRFNTVNDCRNTTFQFHLNPRISLQECKFSFNKPNECQQKMQNWCEKAQPGIKVFLTFMNHPKASSCSDLEGPESEVSVLFRNCTKQGTNCRKFFILKLFLKGCSFFRFHTFKGK